MNDMFFALAQRVLEIISVFFVIYLIGYSTFLFLAVVVGSSDLYKRRQQKELKNTLLQEYYIPVSILVPAYNEEVTILDSISALLYLDYNIYEIIVIDDGSTDNTSKILIDAFDMKHIRRPVQRRVECNREEFIYEAMVGKVPVTLVRKKNGGKADALNMGINISKYPYFICMDADTALQRDSISKIIQPVLEQDNVIAVGGAVRPANDVEIKKGKVVNYHLPHKILPCMQVLEYDRSFLASRILFDKFNGSLIISGAFGLFRKDIVIEAGGYDRTTMGEDMELVVRLHEYCVLSKKPYCVRYASDAICWSQVPESLRDLRKQRKRWHIGLIQSMKKHRVMFFNSRFGVVSYISYLYFLLYELLSPYIELFGLAATLTAFCLDLINVPFMLLFFIIYAVFGCILTLTAFFARTQTIDLKIKAGDAFKAVGLCFLEVTCLRFIMAVVRMTAFSFGRKKEYDWGSIERRRINVK